jgi:ABC-type multidrug transport system fused ATPase/permease subunit
MQTGERQAARIRTLYLEALLSQDVGFFDTDARTGEIVNSISSETLLIQDAISEKVFNSNPSCASPLAPCIQSHCYLESGQFELCKF